MPRYPGYPFCIFPLVVIAQLKSGTSATVLTTHQTISGKADKVTNATEGNFAGLDSNGNLVDSGSKASNFATSAQGSKADSAIQGVKVNNAALTKDANNAVNIPLASYTPASGGKSAVTVAGVVEIETTGT